MVLLKWEQKKFGVGIKQIDDQHKQLIHYINELYEAVSNKANEQLMATIFEKLYAYTQYHFYEEEIYFEQLNKEDVLLHKLQHKHFIEELNGIKESESKGSVCEGLLYFLTDWLINHILSEDLKFIKKNKSVKAVNK